VPTKRATVNDFVVYIKFYIKHIMKSTKSLTVALLVGTIKAHQLKQKDAPAPLETSEAFYAASSERPISVGFMQMEESENLESFDP
jgi:hypothetical protein